MLETRRLKARLPARGFPLALPLALVGCALDPYGISSGAGGSGGGGGPSEPLKELCLNAADDDGNGKTDCADPACTDDYECAPLIPTGWSATQILERATGSDEPAPECKSGNGSLLHADPGPLGTCGACTCVYMDAKCSVPGMACDFDSDTCNNLSVSFSGGTSCKGFGGVPAGFHGEGSCKLMTQPVVDDPGTCAGSPSEMDKPPMWGRDIHLCPLPPSQGGGCEKTDVCVSKPEGAFAAGKMCIEQAGKHECPEGWSAALEAYEDGTDARECTDCACDPGTVTCSGGGYTVYDSGICSFVDATAGVNSFDACQPVKDLFDFSTAGAAGKPGTPQDGTCSNIGTPTGSVLPLNPHTICCQK